MSKFSATSIIAGMDKVIEHVEAVANHLYFRADVVSLAADTAKAAGGVINDNKLGIANVTESLAMDFMKVGTNAVNEMVELAETLKEEDD